MQLYLHLSEFLQRLLPRLCLHFDLNLLRATFVYRTITIWSIKPFLRAFQSAWFVAHLPDANLAMFTFPCMYSQSFMFKFWLISATLFSTNCLYFLSVVSIHVRTTCESVRSTSELMVTNCYNALLTDFINLLRISAPKKSSPAVL